jgi:nicotinamidase-related amidase
MVDASKNPTLHGNAPDASRCALLLIDVINDLAFEGNESFVPNAIETAERIQKLAARARSARVPVVYVNDNFGRWRSDHRGVIEHCLEDGVPGEPMVRQLLPEAQDYFVLKPKHSGFYATPLDTLLSYLAVRHVVIAGFTTDQCVLFTASDAYLRDFSLSVPRDCTTTVVPADHRPALELMEKRLEVDSRPGDQIDFDRLKRADPGDRSPGSA